MLTAIVTVFFTFILTGLLGNLFVQAWQHHNWLVQRRILEAEEQYKALQKTFDEVSELAGKRQHRMLRLLRSLPRNNDEVIRKRMGECDEASALWNERLAAHYAKLTMQLTWELARHLDDHIQPRFVKIDVELTKLAEARLSSGAIVSSESSARLSQALNKLQGYIIRFNKLTLKQIEERKKSLYSPMQFSLTTLDSFPTWELFKALFKPRKIRFDES